MHTRRLAHATMLAALALLARAAAADTTYVLDASAFATRQDSGSVFTEVRPAIGLQLQEPRWTLRAGYLLAASLDPSDVTSLTYSNEMLVELVAELDEKTNLLLDLHLTQGDRAFQLTRGTPDASQVSFLPAVDANRLTATVGQGLVFQTSPALRVTETLRAVMGAPVQALDRYNGAATLVLELSRSAPGARDGYGLDLRMAAARLLPSPTLAEPYLSYGTALQGFWSRDLDPVFNMRLSAGVEQVLTLAGGYPLTVVPRGSLTVNYQGLDGAAVLDVTQAVAADVLTGGLFLGQGVGLRGSWSPDTPHPRVFSASVRFTHATPLADLPARSAIQRGNLIEGDVGLLWGVTESALASARYGVNYQAAERGATVRPALYQVVMLGFTIRYGNGRMTPVPHPGRRVDGNDEVPVNGPPGGR